MSITTYEGASAVFTFADKPAVMMLFLLLAFAITFGTIIIAAVHEKHAYNNH